MKLTTVALGTAMGAAAGMLGILISGGMNGKSKLRRRTVKAMHAIGAVMDSISDYLH